MPDKSKKEPPISYRPPVALREEFYARVERSGLSTNAFITKAIFATTTPRQTRRPPIEKQILARLLAQAAGIRDQLNEIALTGDDDSRNTLIIAAAFDELTAIRAVLLQAMGRKP